MREQLRKALEAAGRGELEPVREAADWLKQLPRTEEGLFDTREVDDDCFAAARWVYPVYAAYETECNKEAGYPDLLAQLHALDRMQKKEATLKVAAAFLETLVITLDYMTPQLYEYYREVQDLFRANVKEVIAAYYREGAFGGEAGKASGEDAGLRKTLAHAGETYCLLAEKYQEYM